MRCRVHVLPAPRSRALHGRRAGAAAASRSASAWLLVRRAEQPRGSRGPAFAVCFACFPVFSRPGFPLCAVTVLGRRSSCDLGRKVPTLATVLACAALKCM